MNSKLAKTFDTRMCIYNSNNAARAAAAKGESLKRLAENVHRTTDEKEFDTQQESPHGHHSNRVGKDLAKTLKMAQKESRIIIGVAAAVRFLSAAPEDSLFCILAPPKEGDSATHIQEVLLKAFCFENDIYTVQVDDSEKLGRLLNAPSNEICILVQKSRLPETSEEIFSSAENAIIDYCEETWDAPQQPIIKLPDT